MDHIDDALFASSDDLIGFIEHLNRFGPRPLASEGERKALADLAERFEGFGLDVDFDTFRVPSYHRGITLAVLHRDGADFPLVGMARVFSPATDGVEHFRLVSLGRGDDADFTKGADRISGAAVYVSDVCPRKYERARRLGAAAYLEPSPDRDNEIFMGAMDLGADFEHCPRVKLTASSGKRIEEAAAASSSLSISLEVTGRTIETEASNLIATLPGTTELPRILVGAHVDTFCLSPGPVDNGTGIAVLVEAARVLSGLPPGLRAVRFALFTGEEVGRLGSIRFAQTPLADPEDVAVFFNLDMPLGGDLVLHVQDGTEETSFYDRLCSDIPEALGYEHVLRRNSDHYSFYRKGIPCLMMRAVAKPGQANLGDWMHSRLDEIDKIDSRELAASARASTRLIRHLSQAETLHYRPFEPAPDDGDLYDDT